LRVAGGTISEATARGLLLYGKQIRAGSLTRKRFFSKIGPEDNAFRDAAKYIGAVHREPGLQFFRSAKQSLAFGPGAGLALGVALGSQSLRAALVDANGELHHKHEGDRVPNQLQLQQHELLGRIREGVGAVLDAALEDESLLVDEALPFLGVSVAWPAPVTREKRTLGYALRHDRWRHGDPLDQLVASELSLDPDLSHAINDAGAAAIGVAYLQTNEQKHLAQKVPRLAMVVRLAGGIGGSTIVVEPPTDADGLGITSGFLASILTGGADHVAGEIGHIPVDSRLVERLNAECPDGLGSLVARQCSCSTDPDRYANHLEAFASAGALAERIDKDAPHAEVAARVLAEPDKKVHKKALGDVGALVGASLAGPIAVLNPATIVLTGAMAVPAVEKTLRAEVKRAHVFGTTPEISILDKDENSFIGVQGAALAVIRRRIFRRFPEILGVPKSALKASVAAATEPLREIPW
jgi:predicted NBD/HSP70 family sugar kinase